MAEGLPRPFLAALGALSGVRHWPARAMNLSVTALALGERARREYLQLAERGEQVVTSLFGAGETTTPQEPVPAADAGAARLTATETAVVLDAVAHVEDPLDTAAHGTPPEGAGASEPIPGYNDMTLGALRGRLRGLSVEDLQRVLAFEKDHQARPPMVTLVEHRLAKLALESGPV